MCCLLLSIQALGPLGAAIDHQLHAHGLQAVDNFTKKIVQLHHVRSGAFVVRAKRFSRTRAPLKAVFSRGLTHGVCAGVCVLV